MRDNAWPEGAVPSSNIEFPSLFDAKLSMHIDEHASRLLRHIEQSPISLAAGPEQAAQPHVFRVRPKELTKEQIMRMFAIATSSAIFAAAALIPAAAQAQSISDVVGARAKDRAGAYLTQEDRDALRRYGSNDDRGYGYYGGSDYGAGYYDPGYSSYDYSSGLSVGVGGSGVSVYVGPGYGYGPYGY